MKIKINIYYIILIIYIYIGQQRDSFIRDTNYELINLFQQN